MFLKRKAKIDNTVKMLNDEDFKKFIEVNTEIVVVAPWNGKPIAVTIRMLDSVAISSCGNFNTVAGSIMTEKELSKEPDIKQMIEVKNIHERLLKLALVHPTFEELEEILIEKDYFKQTKKRIEKIKKDIEEVESEVEKQELLKELDSAELAIAFVLPADFTTYIVTILMQQEATDINKLTRDMLLSAGFLGEKYNTRPSEYLSGVFTEKQKADIDLTALTLVSEYRNNQNIEKGKTHWIRGGSK